MSDLAADRNPGRRETFAFAAALGLLLLVTYAPRISLYQEVQADPSRYIADDVTVATADSFYWLRLAREHRERAEGPPAAADEQNAATPRATPWPARALSIAADVTGGTVYTVAPVFALITSALFMIPMALFGARSGWPAAALVGATLGASSKALYQRTSMFNVDTDALILAGLWTACLLIATVRRETSLTRQLVTTAAAGLATAFVIAWHGNTFYALVFLGTVPLAAFARRIPSRRAALLTLVFALSVGPGNLLGSFQNLVDLTELYAPVVLDAGAKTEAVEPGPRREAPADEATQVRIAELVDDTARSISESRRFPLRRTLDEILRPPWLAGLGLVLSLVWCVFAWRDAVALLPLLGLGVLGLIGSARFGLFLAPFAGFGLGVGLTVATRLVLDRVRATEWASVASICAAVPVAALLLSGTTWSEVSRAYYPASFLRSLQAARETVEPGATVWGHWSSSHVVRDQMRVDTPTAGLPNPKLGHLYLGALVGDSPLDLQRTIAYLESRPRGAIRRAFDDDYFALRRAIAQGPGTISKEAYFALTHRSVRSFSNHYRRGRWSPASGWPSAQIIDRVSCEPMKNARARCSGKYGTAAIDLRRGRFGQLAISRFIITRDGHFEREWAPPHEADSVLVMALDSRASDFKAYVMSGDVASSLLVEMYLLGRHDPRFFELSYDGYPDLRVYRVRSTHERTAETGSPSERP